MGCATIRLDGHVLTAVTADSLLVKFTATMLMPGDHGRSHGAAQRSPQCTKATMTGSSSRPMSVKT